MSSDRPAREPAASVNYSTELLHEEQERRRPMHEALLEFAGKYGVRGWRIVELGSGLGYNLEVLAAGNDVLGIEGLEQAAALASARGVRTVSADLHDPLPLDTASTDLVICLDVLEHLVSPQACLVEVRRVLKPSGMAIVNVPNHFSLSGRLRILTGSGADSLRLFPHYSDWNNPHVRFFRHASICELLRQCGLRILEDWSSAFPAIPVVQRIPRLNRSRAAANLARWRPELFAGGFFLIAGKDTA